MKAVDVTGRDAAILAVAEVGLGSVLHGLKVPLAGHFLSLNQAFLLSRSVRGAKGVREARWLSLSVSNIAALLKTLAPAGKKLTPMLAISAQGLLFSLGTFVLGPTILGTALGAGLMSVWAFMQSAFIAYALFGEDLIAAAALFYGKVLEVTSLDPEGIILAACAILAFKSLIAILLSFLAWRLPENLVQRYLDRLTHFHRMTGKTEILESAPNSTPLREHARRAAGDLVNPLFVGSLCLTMAFFWFSDASFSRVIWGALRPLAIGFLLFFLSRALPLESALSWLESRPFFNSFGKSLRGAIDSLRRF